MLAVNDGQRENETRTMCERRQFAPSRTSPRTKLASHGPHLSLNGPIAMLKATYHRCLGISYITRAAEPRGRLLRCTNHAYISATYVCLYYEFVKKIFPSCYKTYVIMWRGVKQKNRVMRMSTEHERACVREPIPSARTKLSVLPS